MSRATDRHPLGRAVTNTCSSAFVHRKDCGNKDLAVGQAVSFVFEQGSKGASAKNVKEEEGGEIQTETVEEEEDERELGKVKTYNEEKGFAFIVSVLHRSEARVLPILVPDIEALSRADALVAMTCSRTRRSSAAWSHSQDSRSHSLWSPQTKAKQPRSM